MPAPTSQSRSFSLNSNDLQKLVKSAILSALAIGVTVFLQEVAKWDLGPYTPVTTGVSAFLLNLIHKFVKGS